MNNFFLVQQKVQDGLDGKTTDLSDPQLLIAYMQFTEEGGKVPQKALQNAYRFAVNHGFVNSTRVFSKDLDEKPVLRNEDVILGALSVYDTIIAVSGNTNNLVSFMYNTLPSLPLEGLTHVVPDLYNYLGKTHDASAHSLAKRRLERIIGNEEFDRTQEDIVKTVGIEELRRRLLYGSSSHKASFTEIVQDAQDIFASESERRVPDAISLRHDFLEKIVIARNAIQLIQYDVRDEQRINNMYGVHISDNTRNQLDADHLVAQVTDPHYVPPSPADYQLFGIVDTPLLQPLMLQVRDILDTAGRLESHLRIFSDNPAYFRVNALLHEKKYHIDKALAQEDFMEAARIRDAYSEVE